MRMKTTQKRATNVTLPEATLLEARALGINLSQACEKGVVAEISIKRREKWLAENMAAIEERNAWVEKHGLPLAKYRMF
jgi:antitoxin CcdA